MLILIIISCQMFNIIEQYLSAHYKKGKVVLTQFGYLSSSCLHALLNTVESHCLL